MSYRIPGPARCIITQVRVHAQMRQATITPVQCPSTHAYALDKSWLRRRAWSQPKLLSTRPKQLNVHMHSAVWPASHQLRPACHTSMNAARASLCSQWLALCGRSHPQSSFVRVASRVLPAVASMATAASAGPSSSGQEDDDEVHCAARGGGVLGRVMACARHRQPRPAAD